MKDKRSKKLILFDIDGTLVHSSGTTVSHWQERVRRTMLEAFGKEIQTIPTPKKYNGWPDMQILWDLARQMGISDEAFNKKIPTMQSGVALLELLSTQAVHEVGLITGNFQSSAFLKLESAGVKYPFTFGLYGDMQGDRNALAQMVFEKSQKHFGRLFAPGDVVVIGDTVHDIRAGKSIGAVTIAVTTGITDGREQLARETPDILVNSLMDHEVRDFFGV